MRQLFILAVAVVLGLALAGVAHGQETVPAAPTDLQAVIFADLHFVGLTWQNNADNADGYQIERSTVSADGPWQTIATIPLVISKCDRPPCYFDTPSLNGDYWYRVAAVNAAGTSAYSNIVYAEIVAQPTREPGEIRGMVFYDRNANGTRDAGEEGLSGMRISRFPGGELQTVTTGDTGEYVFGDLSPGLYTVEANLRRQQSPFCSTTAFSFDPLQRGACLAPFFPWKPTSPDGIEVTVRGGVRLDFGARPADVAVWVGDAILELDHPPAGTEIVALVNGHECGAATVTGGSAYDFMIDVLGAGERPGCARPGDLVQFTVGGVPAAEAAGWSPFTDPRNPAQRSTTTSSPCSTTPGTGSS
jgi:hypothetical protein